jgi:hypothetical protein
LGNDHVCKSREATRSNHVGLSYITQSDAWPNAEVGTDTDKGIRGTDGVLRGRAPWPAQAGQMNYPAWVMSATL